jgi:hypothetical protein
MAAPVDAFGSGEGADRAGIVHDVKLPGLPSGVICNERLDGLPGAASLAQEVQPFASVERIDQRLGRHRADAAFQEGNAGAEREEAARRGEADYAAAGVACNERPGHLQFP